MTNQKIKDVCSMYLNELKSEGFEPRRQAATEVVNWKTSRLSHAAWMAEQAIAFVDEGRKEKANRWLGFVQGILWSTGFYTIYDMKNHNMPGEEDGAV